MGRLPIFALLGLASACSTTSSGSSDAVNQPAASTASCDDVCCAMPEAGSPCSSDASTTRCAWAATCESGLVVSREVACSSGVWTSTNDCPTDGGSDLYGCPATQPTAGSACATAGAQCGYALACNGYRKSAVADCDGGAWQTTPLGACN